MLEVRHVSKTFNPGTIDAKKALDDAAEEIAQNEIKLSDGLAALESGKAELAQGEADYAAAETGAKAGFAEAEAELQKANI